MVICRDAARGFVALTKSAKHEAARASAQHGFPSKQREAALELPRSRYAFEGGQVQLFLTEKLRGRALSEVDL
jgi:hypothetical protein